jgi:hypothetical protein
LVIEKECNLEPKKILIELDTKTTKNTDKDYFAGIELIIQHYQHLLLHNFHFQFQYFQLYLIFAINIQ